MRPLHLAAASRGDHGDGPEVPDGSDDRVRVIAFVGQHGLSAAAFEQRQRLGIFGGVACREAERDRLAEAVGQQVDLGRQSTSGTPQSLVFAPFLRPVAACW